MRSISVRKYTVGMEVELADVDRKTPLPEGLSWSGAEFDIVNSDGRAIDPSGKIHTMGGEINTAPSFDIETQVNYFKKMLELFPHATINHRGHQHMHVAFEGLKENLEAQKKILKYVRENSEEVFKRVFTPTRTPDMNNKAYAYQIIDRSIMPEWKYNMCMAATTTEEFKLAHAKVKDGTVMYQTMKRYAVNLYSITKHGTVEFRHFFPTLDPDIIRDTLKYCVAFVHESLKDNPRPVSEIIDWSSFKFPTEVPYNKFIEESWQEGNYK